MRYTYQNQNVTNINFTLEDGRTITKGYVQKATEAQLAEIGVITTIEPEIVPYVPTAEELTNNVKYALQNEIDTKAQSLGFSNGNSLMLYAGFNNPFKSLAVTFATWEATVWAEAEAYKSQVLTGSKPMLTGEEAVALMPNYPL